MEKEPKKAGPTHPIQSVADYKRLMVGVDAPRQVMAGGVLLPPTTLPVAAVRAAMRSDNTKGRGE